MDIKLSYDGGTELVSGDFNTVTDIDELKMNINKVIRGWNSNYIITKYIGMHNTRSSGLIIQKDLNTELSKYFVNLRCKVIPVERHKILIIVGIPGVKKTIHQVLFNMTDGVVDYISVTDSNKYSDKINPHI